ncbi:MAG: LamG domain-containing protein, partial [Planctomycetota bacterium]
MLLSLGKRFLPAALAVSCLIALARAGQGAEARLLAHFTFDQGEGTTLTDDSGNGNDGVIHDAAWVKTAAGGALKFRRTGSYVDFGPDSPLKLSGDFTILAWVKLQADPYPDNETNWTILDCEEYRKSGFLVRIDGARSTVLYRSSQEGAAQQRPSSVALANNTFYHIAVTKEAGAASYFVNGTPDIRFQVEAPGPGAFPFMISSKGQSFNGLIDDLTIYEGALGKEEIRTAYEREALTRDRFEEKVTRKRVDSGPALNGDGFTVRVGSGGGTQLEIDGDVYFVETSYSYPGKSIGYNHMSEGLDSGDTLWKPTVRSFDANAISVSASGGWYSLRRTITLQGHAVLIADMLTNTSDRDVGVIVRNALISGEKPVEWRLCGVPGTASATVRENPTVLLAQQKSALGAVADDNVSRAQFRASAASNHAEFGLERL